MDDFRIDQHPILPIRSREKLEFYWQGQRLTGLTGETIAAALFASGIHVFGHHHKDGSPPRQLGAEFQFDESVVDLVVSGGRLCGVKTNRGTYSCSRVLLAAGAWAQPLAQSVGMYLPVNPDSHEAAITEPVQRFLEPLVVDIRPAPGSANYYFYQHATGQIIFCITPSPNIWGCECCETSSFLPMVSRRMVEVMPCLTNLRVRRTWRGLYPMTPDGFPLIGWSQEADGLLVAAGMCGQGLMLGPGVGELLTRMVKDDLTESDAEILSLLSPYREFVGQEKLK